MSPSLDPSFEPPAGCVPPCADLCAGHRERLRALRPDLPCGGAAFRAALVLLAAPAARFNIDRLARRTGAPRHWVAACARRLYDNGVWSARGAAYPWSGPEDFRFWNDVEVAEGKLLRRVDDRGRPQWAPAGAWSKEYDFVGPRSDPGGAVLYVVPEDAAAEPGPELPPHLELVRGGPEAAREETVRDETEPEEREAFLPAGPWLPGMATDEAPLLAAAGGARGAVPELFPGATWLG
ncbi:MAG TPA: hypothetical protein VF746_18195 [Longimicrobium sp.]|jgi:hypothetical protein